MYQRLFVDINILNNHIENCHKTDTAVLIENDISALINNKIDGIYFSEQIKLKQLKEIRQKYPETQIGINCGLSKNDGLSYGEAGADFIVFESGDDELINWWVEMTELPVVVNGASQTDTSADFIMLASNG